MDRARTKHDFEFRNHPEPRVVDALAWACQMCMNTSRAGQVLGICFIALLSGFEVGVPQLEDPRDAAPSRD